MLLTTLRSFYRFARNKTESAKSSKPAAVPETKTASDCQPNQIAPFPYVFNGISTDAEDQPYLYSSVPQKTIFEQVYKSFLNAVNDRDQKKLQNLLLPQLVQPFLNKNLKYSLIHKNSPVTVLYHKVAMYQGLSFPISQDINLKQTRNRNNLRFVYATNDDAVQKQMPALITLTTTVISKARLALPGDQEEKEVPHQIKFYYQGNLRRQWTQGYSHFQLLRLTFQGHLETIHMKNLYKQNNQWKICDVDKFKGWDI